MPRSDDLRRQLIAGAIVTALALAVIFGGRVYDWLVDAGNGFEAEPIERIHAELLPSWALSVSGTRGSKPEPEAFDALMAEIEASGAEGLADVARKLRREMQRGRPASELTELLIAWNDLLDEQGIPFVIRGGSLSSPSGLQYFITAARTRHDLRVAVGERDVRMRVVERVDSINVRESVLGENTEVVDGGLLLSDRMLEFAIERLWPVLDEDTRMPGWALAFATDVRAEVRRDLPPEAFGLLEKTAGARMKAVEAALAIQSRTACSRFILARLHWNGLGERDLDTLEENIEHGECPKVYEVEYEAIRDFSRAARATDGLQGAVETLLAWSMRPIAMHEARHAADHEITGTLSEPVPCSACAGLSARERTELSAYAAQFAWTDQPATSTFQACLAIGTRGGSHRGAISFLLDQLDADCVLGMPEASQTQAFVRRAFDRDAPISLPEAWPESVALPPRATLPAE